MTEEYVERKKLLNDWPCCDEPADAYQYVRDFPSADVVPWEFLERYADYFCAAVSMPEFIREAKMFYKDTNKAMEGGHIDA